MTKNMSEQTNKRICFLGVRQKRGESAGADDDLVKQVHAKALSSSHSTVDVDTLEFPCELFMIP